MYNKCEKCNKMLGVYDPRKLILDPQGKITTRCKECYEMYLKIKAV